MKICIASDHGGYDLKQSLINVLKNNYDIEDLGTNSKESVDYPKFAFLVGENVSNKIFDFGILICGTGIGMSIACNKVKGVRCAKTDSIEEAALTRIDNDANVIAINGKKNIEDAKAIIETFLTTKHEYIERHDRRINIISKYERGEKIDT